MKHLVEAKPLNGCSRQPRPTWWVWALLAAASLGGCQAPTDTRPGQPEPATTHHATTTPRTEPITSTDPCAMRLHDLCGGLLLYFARHGDLPARLDDLDTIPGLDDLGPWVCPVSNRPYIYNPHGILMPERGERVILYDPLASHSGMRWAIRIQEPIPGEPLVARVIALPESFFLLRQ